MTMAVAYSNQEEEKYESLVKNYFAYRFQRKGLYIPGFEETNLLLTPNQHEIALTLRRVGDELEARDNTFFEHMWDDLHISPNTAYSTFRGIADEIFSSEKNWGRIVAFLTFGSTLAMHCASREDMGAGYVNRVASWVSKYMEQNLDSWIQDHGSWNGFLEFFHRFDFDRNNDGNHNGFLVSALGGVVIGALVMMSFK